MVYTLSDIAEALGTHVLGASDLEITSVAEPADAGPDQLALAMKPEYAEGLKQGRARAAIVWDGADWAGMGLEAAIIAPRPRFAMAGVTQMLDPGQGWGDGIHPSAIVDPAASIGEDVHIGPLSVIMAGAQLGNGTRIGAQCFIGMDAQIGAECVIREGCKLMARVTIGNRVMLHPGAVIGGDGFSFVTPEVSNVEKARETLKDTGDAKAQSYARIHSLGAVRIADDVEVGSNTTVDRGTIRDTVIGPGTKIDNLVQVGHNTVIGHDCLICGLSGLAGSVRVGNNVVLGGRVGVADNTIVGDNVVAAGGAKIISNVPAGRVVMGYPATKMDQQIELYKQQRRLGRLFKDVAEMKKTLAERD